MNINYTHFLKLMNVLRQNKTMIFSFIQCEKEQLCDCVKDSYWGFTQSQKNYLNLLDELNVYNQSFFRKLYLRKFKKKIIKQFDYKIRVVFFCYEFQTFPTFQTLYNKLKNDQRFVCDLVHVPFFHADKTYNEKLELKDYVKAGYLEILSSDTYDLVQRSPDIAFFLKPYDLIPKQYYIDEIEKVVAKSIYIPYGMEIGATKESMRYQFQLPLHDKAWMCISYCNEHYKRACQFSKQHGKNFILLGHPRMDLIHCDMRKEHLYKLIKKRARGRKIYMWNPHFTIEGGDNWGTFLDFGIDILKYFAIHKDIFLLYRPHPFFEEALQKACKNDSKLLLQYHSLLNMNRDNIYLDKSGNYLISLHVADVLISDANSFVPEFLIYGKPVIYTKKRNTTGFNNPELEKLLYTCTNKKEIINNVELLKKNCDYLANDRKIQLHKIFQLDENQSVSDKIIDRIVSYFEQGGIENDKKNDNN